MGSVIPFTLLGILPTNRKLLNPALDKRTTEIEPLLSRWGALHAVRSVLSGLALLLFLYLAISRSLTEQCEAQGRLRGKPRSGRSSLLKWGVGPGNIDRVE